MNIPAPTDAQLDELRARHAHRHPQSATLSPPGDRGVGKVKIAILIGLPSGACRMPTGALIAPAWSEFIPAALSRGKEPPGFRDALARDVVLYPEPAELERILDYWPGLAGSIATLALKKAGRGCVSDPTAREKPPAPVADYLAANPRATWFHVKPPRATAHVAVLIPPGAAEYSIFSDAMRARESEPWQLVRDFVDVCVPLVTLATGEPATIGALLDRWPGAALALAAEVGALAGAGAAAELGE